LIKYEKQIMALTIKNEYEDNKIVNMKDKKSEVIIKGI